MAPVHGIKLCFAFCRTILFPPHQFQYCLFRNRQRAIVSRYTGIIGPQFPPKYRWRYRCRPTPSETTRTFTQLLYRNPSTDLVMILNQIIIIIEDIRFNMAIEVLPITTADIPAAVACIQRAFADDPYFQWIFNPSKVQHLHRISQK